MDGLAAVCTKGSALKNQSPVQLWTHAHMYGTVRTCVCPRKDVERAVSLLESLHFVCVECVGAGVLLWSTLSTLGQRFES